MEAKSSLLLNVGVGMMETGLDFPLWVETVVQWSCSRELTGKRGGRYLCLACPPGNPTSLTVWLILDTSHCYQYIK